MPGNRCVLDFDLTVTVLANVEWYLEWTSDSPNDASARLRREVAEEDIGGGVVRMPKVVRNFQENGGAALAAGTHRLNCQFVKEGQFFRIQIRAQAGTVTRAIVSTPFGTAPIG